MANPLAAYLTATGQKQAEFAAKHGIRKATISEIVNGKANPTLKTLQRIATATGGVVPVTAWFHDGTHTPNPDVTLHRNSA